MKRQEVIDAIKAMGLRCKFVTETQEFRITPNMGPLPGGRLYQKAYWEREENAAYYTQDKLDAIGTAKHMAEHAERMANLPVGVA